MKIADYIAQREADLALFTFANRAEIFSNGTKTRELNHGTLKLELSHASIDLLPAEKGQDKTPWQIVAEKVQKALIKALSAMRLGAGKHNEQLIRLKTEPNKQYALAAFKRGDITEEQLGNIGLLYNKPVDKFHYEAKAEQIESHASDKAA